MPGAAAVHFATAAALVAVCAIVVRADIKERRIPNVCVACLLALAVFDMLLGYFDVPGWPGLFDPAQRLTACALTFVLGLVFELCIRRLQGGAHGVGFGDIKLAAACAAWLGDWILYCVALACCSAVVFSLATSARTFAFGPHIIGAFLVLLAILSLR